MIELIGIKATIGCVLWLVGALVVSVEVRCAD